MAGGVVSVKVDDADVRKAMNRSQAGVNPAVRKAFKTAGVFLVARMREKLQQHGKVDRGDNGGLLGAITYEVNDRRGRMELVAGPTVGGEEFMVHAETIEHGRRPGSAMPPQGVLLPWMGRKGIPAAAEFPIRRKIAEEGLQGQPFPFMAPAYAEIGPLAAQALDDIGDALVRTFAS